MSMSRPAVLSSAMVARQGAAAPTGYTPIRPQDINATRTAQKTAGNLRPAIAPVAVIVGGSSSTDSERTRVSVRLDRDRHLKLKLTAAHLRNSLQDIITDALDRYLEQIGSEIVPNNCACLGINNRGVTNAAAQCNWRSD